MSTSSAHYSSGDASYFNSSSDSNTLLHKNKETLSNPKDIFLQSEDALPHLADALPYPLDALPYLADTPPSPLLHKDTRSTMPLPRDRSKHRDVHIFNISDRDTSIGGLILTASITNTNLYSMIEIFVIFNGVYILQNESDITIEKDDSPVLPGNYYIDSRYPILINDEIPLLRTTSLQSGTRVQAFTDAIRSRDRRCVLTGEEYLDDDNWRGFEAAHIFPLAYEQYWTAHGFSRWISIIPDRGGAINSTQNGILLESAIHQLFDSYDISINPDDNYKIVCFSRDRKRIAGKYLDRRLLDDPQRSVDPLLRWHFWQAVLTNMKGVGEPIFEHDFPPGSDIVGSILEGPKAAQRMEFELFSRFAAKGLIV